MADYTLEDGEGTSIREDGGLLEGYVDLDITGLGVETTPVSGDKFWITTASGNRQIDVDDMPGGAGGGGLPTNYLDGLEINPDSGDVDHDIEISVGRCRNGADGIDIVLASVLTKRIDAAWAVGDNNGGLDTGSAATGNRYFIWIIKRIDTSVVDALISLSSTAPTMPASYASDNKRRIGSFYYQTGTSPYIGAMARDKKHPYQYPPTPVFKGFKMEIDSIDANHDVGLDAGFYQSSGININLIRTNDCLSIVKKIDTAWVEGSYTGGMRGTLASNTWFHYFICCNPTTGAVDAFYDEDLTTPNPPTGFTEYVRVCSVLTDSSSNILPVIQIGNFFLWKDTKEDWSQSNLSTSGASYTLSTPLGTKTNAHVRIILNSVGTRYVILTSLEQTNVVPSLYICDVSSNSGTATPISAKNLVTNTSSQVRGRANSLVSTTITTFGWTEIRD